MYKQLSNFELCEVLGQQSGKSTLHDNIELIMVMKSRLLDHPEKRMYQIQARQKGKEWMPDLFNEFLRTDVRGTDAKDTAERYCDAHVDLWNNVDELRVNLLGSDEYVYFDQGMVS